MSVSRMRIRNFRGYKAAELHLKPLTVLLGPNSSGKSSFSHPLAALAHCQHQYAGRRDATLTPSRASEAQSWPIDLGGQSDLRTSGSEERISVGLASSSGWVDFSFGGVSDAADNLLLSKIELPQNIDVTTSLSLEQATGDDNLIEPEGNFRSEIKVNPNTSPYYDDLRLVVERINLQQWQSAGQEMVVGLDGLFPLSLQHPSGTPLKLNFNALSEVREFLSTLTYLRATRKRASRGYEYFKSETNSVGYSGERAPSILRNLADVMNSYIAPPSRPTRKPDGRDEGWGQEESSLPIAVSKWLQHLQLAGTVSTAESRNYGPEFVDVRFSPGDGQQTRDITEVGFGLSQVLPVIVAALLQPEGGMLLVDLPEAHLHPQPQGDLADLFCALVMNGRWALIETHSELFFHRLRLRAAMHPALQDKIGVFFLDRPTESGCSAPRPIGLRANEEIDWPTGFLQDSLDSELQIRFVRQTNKNNA